MRLCAVSEPPHSVRGSPRASSEVHWFHPSLAHDWRTVLSWFVSFLDNARLGPRPDGPPSPEHDLVARFVNGREISGSLLWGKPFAPWRS
jgi:hypothetical protein